MITETAQLQAENELEEIELLILNASDLCDLFPTDKIDIVNVDRSNTIIEEYYAGSIGSSVYRDIKSGKVRKIIAG